MKKLCIVIIIFFVLIGLAVYTSAYFNKDNIKPDNNYNKTVSNKILKNNQYKYIPTTKKGQAKYYIKNDTDYNLQFLCFNENECYNINPNIVEIKNKKFVGFGRYHYFDIDTYRYDKNTHTYHVDVLVDRNPSTDLEIYNKSPFDSGNITHLIFSLTYSPTQKEFSAAYKGFVSSEDITEYDKGIPITIHTNYLNIYYDNNIKYIEDLSNWLKFFNNEVVKELGKSNNYGYDIEIEYIIPYYLN